MSELETRIPNPVDEDLLQSQLVMDISALSTLCHNENIRWWKDPATGDDLERNPAELIALIHSELSEALEGVRKGLQDEHIPQYKSEEVEMADALIRIFDYCGGRGLRVGEAMFRKIQYNRVRVDHTNEERLKDGGKKF